MYIESWVLEKRKCREEKVKKGALQREEPTEGKPLLRLNRLPNGGTFCLELRITVCGSCKMSKKLN